MLKFVTVSRKPPHRRPADERRADFAEIYDPFEDSHAGIQASRCSQCGVPFCQSGCPLGNNIPDWLRLASEGRLKEAYEMSAATSTMPEVCGRICPQDRLCEGSCVIEQSGHGTVTIGAVEQYLTETAFREGWVGEITPAAERGQGVGIIGAGPAGLTAAEKLRELGYGVTVYDRYDRAGGLLVYGIPGFKLEKHVVQRRVERLVRAGVQFVTDCNIGETIQFEDLRTRHDAILIATGVYKARNLAVPGIGSDGVVPALDFLTAANRIGFGDDVPAYTDDSLNADGKRVVVIGGGDTAMDCVRTAIRQNAASVTCVYRRDRANMPGSAREVANAEEEGIRFDWLSAPQAVLSEGTTVSGLKVARMRLGAPDSDGRQRPEPIEGAADTLQADLVIKALGFEPEDLPTLFGLKDVTVSSRGTIRVHPETFETKEPGIFAAGDIVRGASLVVWAIHDGLKAAAGIHQSLAAMHDTARHQAAE
ncbi:MAG: NAD(P)-dependent oxidoreductase [Pseudomonadota bacterium]